MSVLEYGLSITPHLRRSSSTWHQHPQCPYVAAEPVLGVQLPQQQQFSTLLLCVWLLRLMHAKPGPVAECVASVPKGLAPVAVVMMLAPVLYAVPMPEVE